MSNLTFSRPTSFLTTEFKKEKERELKEKLKKNSNYLDGHVGHCYCLHEHHETLLPSDQSQI
ncbi:hypothetical protein LguiA_028542 [Lonicera macranthoides]